MSKVLFLSMPSHGNVNPTLGLASELVKQGEEVIYFCSAEFREKVEATGSNYREYTEDLDIFKGKGGLTGHMQRILRAAPRVIANILEQVKDIKFDYLVHSTAFPFTKVIANVLRLPTVSSLAVFAGIKVFLEKGSDAQLNAFPGMDEMMVTYRLTAQRIRETYGVILPNNLLRIIFNKGDINLVYTSKYFAPEPEFFDESYKFVGPPIYNRQENIDFPFEQLKGKKVIYISLGTVFSTYSLALYDIFFNAFANTDAIVVLAAYGVDVSAFSIPSNFIVRNYVPQSELLKYTTVAVTHAGMNSISDLVSNHIPFVSIPLGADQPILAARAQELGAAISLDAKTLDAEQLKAATDKVLSDPSYLQNIKKIAMSFAQAGGYPKAVQEVFKMKQEKGIGV